MSSDLILPAGIEQVDGHRVAGVQGPVGVGIACECGRWQAYVTGPSSAGWARRDYDEHVRQETGGSS